MFTRPSQIVGGKRDTSAHAVVSNRSARHERAEVRRAFAFGGRRLVTVDGKLSRTFVGCRNNMIKGCSLNM